MLSRKKIIIIVFFTFLLLVVTIFLAELSFRLLWKYLPAPIPDLAKRYVFTGEEDKSDIDIKGIHFLDKDCGLSLAPNKTVTYKTDEFEVGYSTSRIPSTNFGYRTKNINEEPETFTSLFLGDSFAFGLGVNYEDSFFYLFKEAMGLKDIINVSVSGIDTYDYFLKISCYLDMFPIEKIYLAIYMGNDLFPKFNSLEKEKKRKKKKEKLNRKLAIYRLIKGLKQRKASYEIFKTNDVDTFWNYTSPFKFLEYDAEKSIAYVEYREFIEKIITLCGIRKTKLYLILIPDKIQVYEDEVKGILKKPAEYDFTKPNKFTSIICEQHDIPLYDATSYLKKIAKESAPDKIYYEYDIHFNSLGNKAMADYLIAKFK